MERIGTALIGVGRIGQVHLRNMINGHSVNIFWLVDNTEIHKKIEELAKTYNLKEAQLSTPENVDRVLCDKRVQVVVVCVPTIYHKEFVIKSLRAGKHVFCEKPLCENTADVRECYEEARLQSRVLMCALNRRFDKQFLKVFDLIRGGKLGRLRTVKMESRDNQMNVEYYEKNKGGIFIDMGIHDIDYICWLVGEEPDYCTAIGSRTSDLAEGYQSYGEYDTAMGVIKFKNGVLVNIDLCRVTCGGYQQSVRILGTKQIAEITNIRESSLQITDNEGTHQSPFYLVDGFLDRYLESFEEEMSHFLHVVRGKGECMISSDSVVNTTRLAHMLTKALHTGEKVFWDENLAN